MSESCRATQQKLQSHVLSCLIRKLLGRTDAQSDGPTTQKSITAPLDGDKNDVCLNGRLTSLF